MNDRSVSLIVTWTLSIAAAVAIVHQCRRPWWWPGRLVIWIMNVRHAAVTRWGLGHVAIEPPFTILDVGCGGGKTIQTLATMASAGKVCGIDYSSASVAAARQVNAAAIACGRVDIQQASVSCLPFSDSTFDLASAVETHYYWPEPVDDLREILRVLKPGGRLIVIAETYKGSGFSALLALPMALLRARYLTADEHRQLFTAAGFVGVTIEVVGGKGWICAVGEKPAVAA